MKNYDPGLVVVTFFGITLTGFHSGTFVKCERDEDTWKKEKGAQGEGVRTRNRNKGGRITLTLQGAAPCNADLSNKALADERNGTGKGPVSVEDLNGTTLWSAKDAWLIKPADLEYADEHTPREWVLDCDELEWFTDGSAA